MAKSENWKKDKLVCLCKDISRLETSLVLEIWFRVEIKTYRNIILKKTKEIFKVVGIELS